MQNFASALRTGFLASGALTGIINRQLGKSYGHTSYSILGFLWFGNELPSVGQILEVLGITKQSLRPILDRLINDGLLAQERDEDDRRRVRLSLTPDGDRVASAMINILRAFSISLEKQVEVPGDGDLFLHWKGIN